jgi:hypothetical protein
MIQERAFGLLRKVYAKRAKLRGEQPLNARPTSCPGHKRRYLGPSKTRKTRWRSRREAHGERGFTGKI